MMKLFFQNMVSNRCKVLVKSEIEGLGYHCTTVELCEVEIEENISAEKKEQLCAELEKIGYPLIEDHKTILIEQIKAIIIELVHYRKSQLKTNLSDYLSEKLQYDYSYLANIFSETHGHTIEYFFLTHRIERAKELLAYDELNITEIADKLHFSSVAHLSNQFKKMTGLTPSQYKHLRIRKRQPLEKV
jgi:AraC-like DNA-binding protein